MSEKKYYPGFVDVDLKSGKYNVVSEQNPDSLKNSEEKLNKFLVEAKHRDFTIGEISDSNKTNVLKEVMVIGDDVIGFGYISDIYMPVIEPWNKQIQMQMFTYDMMNNAQKSSNNKSIFTKIIDFIKS